MLFSVGQPKCEGKLPGQVHYENLCMKAVNQSIGAFSLTPPPNIFIFLLFFFYFLYIFIFLNMRLTLIINLFMLVSDKIRFKG